MLGIEGDGAAKLAPRFQPGRARRSVVQNVQRVIRKQRQHQCRLDPRLVGDDIDHRRTRIAGNADAIVGNAVSKLERHVKQRLGKAQVEPERLDHADQHPGKAKAGKQSQCQDHAALSQRPPGRGSWRPLRRQRVAEVRARSMWGKGKFPYAALSLPLMNRNSCDLPP